MIERRIALKAKALTSLIAIVCIGIVSICGMAWAMDEAVLTPTNDSVKSAEEETFNSAMSVWYSHRYADGEKLLGEFAKKHRIAHGGGDPGVAYEYNFAYDDAGNRTRWETIGGPTINYTYDAANKMTSPGTYTYDDKGNTLTHTVGNVTTTYTWDHKNRLTEWQKTGETTQDYVYDGNSMRVSETPLGGAPRSYLLDGIEIAEEISGNDVTTYVGPRGGTVGHIAGGLRSIYHAERMGSVCAITNDSAQVTKYGVHDAFGNAVLAGLDQPFGFAGQQRYYTDTTGLRYVKARYYDSATGRFISRDPLRYGSNHYVYVMNRPTVEVDPSGLFGIGCALGAIGGWIGGEVGNIGGGGTTGLEKLCNAGTGCLLGGITEELFAALPEKAPQIIRCALGAGSSLIGGAGGTSMCHQLFGKCPKSPINWKCTIISNLAGAALGCASGFIDDPILGAATSLAITGINMLVDSACNNPL